MVKGPNRSQKRNNPGYVQRNRCHFPRNLPNFQEKNVRERENEVKTEENSTLCNVGKREREKPYVSVCRMSIDKTVTQIHEAFYKMKDTFRNTVNLSFLL